MVAVTSRCMRQVAATYQRSENMKLYSNPEYATRAAKVAIGKTDHEILFPLAVSAKEAENKKWYAQITLEHSKRSANNEQVALLEGFELVFAGEPKKGEERKGGIEALLPARKAPLVTEHSTVESPVQVVWNFCDENPTMARKDIIRELVESGVNKNTAATQYARWKKAKQEEEGEEE